MLKLLVLEEGSELAEELWRRASVRIASWLLYAEARTALAAARRAGRISGHDLKGAVRDLEAACESMQLIGVDAVLARSAGALGERFELRGYDAMHLASALSVGDPALLFATWDIDLASAVVKAGRSVAPAPDA